MGIKGLSKFIKEHVPSCITKKALSDLSGKIIAIDTNYYLYKYTISSDDFLTKFLKQYEHLRSYGIKPLYVFDGKPPTEKLQVIEKRKKVNQKKNILVSTDKIKCLKKHFDLSDIAYIECEAEADFICGKLSNEDLIYGCISDDMDFLALGCKYLYRDYYQYSSEITEYSLKEILCKYSKDKFIDICIFLGCDYCERVYDFVNRTLSIDVHDLFHKYLTLENVWEFLYKNEMFLYVDEEKQNLVIDKWGKAREILRNDNNFDFLNFYKKIVKVLETLDKLSDKIPCLIDFDIDSSTSDYTYIKINHPIKKNNYIINKKQIDSVNRFNILSNC